MEKVIFKRITAEILVEYVNKNDIKLISTHKELSIRIINRIYQKMVNDINFNEIKVFEDLITDGHHRYISSLLANKEIGTIPSLKTSATEKFDWKNVEFLDEEWDTPQKIERLNKEDADFNNIPLERIVEMTK